MTISLQEAYVLWSIWSLLNTLCCYTEQIHAHRHSACNQPPRLGKVQSPLHWYFARKYLLENFRTARFRQFNIIAIVKPGSITNSCSILKTKPTGVPCEEIMPQLSAHLSLCKEKRTRTKIELVWGEVWGRQGHTRAKTGVSFAGQNMSKLCLTFLS